MREKPHVVYEYRYIWMNINEVYILRLELWFLIMIPFCFFSHLLSDLDFSHACSLFVALEHFLFSHWLELSSCCPYYTQQNFNPCSTRKKLKTTSSLTMLSRSILGRHKRELKFFVHTSHIELRIIIKLPQKLLSLCINVAKWACIFYTPSKDTSLWSPT